MNPGDLTTLANAKEWLGLNGLAVSGITNANPAVVALAAKPPVPLSSGLTVGLTAVNGMTQVNGGEYPITVVDATHFSVPIDATAFGVYTDGGLVGITDSLVQRLVSAVSTYIQAVLNRTIRNLPYSEVRSGLGGSAMLTLNFPITSVAALTIDGITIPPRPPLGAGSNSNFVGFGWQGGPAGYTFDALRVMLSGLYAFTRGYSNVALSYAAGFLIANEPQTIPGTGPFVLTTQARWNAGDRGVTYANGTALTLVTGVPATGQYAVDANGVYTFAAADAGKVVLISYGYVPFDIEQAAVDMIGDWFKYRSRIGTLSESIEAQTITFTNTAITARAQGVLNQYRRVAPVMQ